MKYLSSKEKIRLEKRRKKKYSHEKKRKEKRKRLYLSKVSKTYRNRERKVFLSKSEPDPKDIMIVPKIFSLIQNPVETIGFMKLVEERLHQKRCVYMDLGDVEVVSPETMTFLCASIKDRKFTHGTPIRGNYPKDKKLKNMFVKSEFDHLLRSSNEEDYKAKNINDHLIHRVTGLRGHGKLSRRVCEDANRNTFGDSKYKIKNLYPILGECMQNTWQHAGENEQEHKRNWWLFTYKEPGTKITKFCFLDLGIGALFSIRHKILNKSIKGSALALVNIDNETNALKRYFEGKEHKSATLKKERGRGLHHIFSCVMKHDGIRNFTFISNNVVAKIVYNKGISMQIIKENIQGTVYYWELTPVEKQNEKN